MLAFCEGLGALCLGLTLYDENLPSMWQSKK